jgi:hypothetical protein
MAIFETPIDTDIDTERAAITGTAIVPLTKQPDGEESCGERAGDRA